VVERKKLFWTHKRSDLYKKFVCFPCVAAVGGSKERCISLTGAGILFNPMTKEQIGNIGRLFAQAQVLYIILS
jgi:hypothetical protein